jgi:hypothetical protein
VDPGLSWSYGSGGRETDIFLPTQRFAWASANCPVHPDHAVYQQCSCANHESARHGGQKHRFGYRRANNDGDGDGYYLPSR